MSGQTAAAPENGAGEALAPYLAPGWFVDSDHAAIAEYAFWAAGGATGEVELACRLYYAVRDDILYDPYGIPMARKDFRASACLARGRGFCITKAALLAACARAVGMPARVGYGDVRNHLTTRKLMEVMGTDLFVFHGYAQLWIDGRWVKATPAFNKTLCDRFGVKSLEFDGREDSLFHPFDVEGRKHMEYVAERGQYADIPYDEITAVWRDTYRAEIIDSGFGVPGADFHAEAAAERAWVANG